MFRHTSIFLRVNSSRCSLFLFGVVKIFVIFAFADMRIHVPANEQNVEFENASDK